MQFLIYLFIFLDGVFYAAQADPKLSCKPGSPQTHRDPSGWITQGGVSKGKNRGKEGKEKERKEEVERGGQKGRRKKKTVECAGLAAAGT